MIHGVNVTRKGGLSCLPVVTYLKLDIAQSCPIIMHGETSTQLRSDMAVNVMRRISFRKLI